MTSRRLALILAGLAGVLAAFQVVPPPASSQGGKPSVERLYILNCGEGMAGDISRWSPGVNVGKSMDFVNSCYLIKHSKVGCCGIPECPMPSPPCPKASAPPIRARLTGGDRRRSRPSLSNSV